MRMPRKVICVLPGSTIFFHVISQNRDLKKVKLLNTECVFWFSLQMSPETFPILRRNERDMIKNAHWSSYKVLVVLVRFSMKPEFSGYIFDKYSNNKFHENPLSGTRDVPCRWMDGQTDRHDETKVAFAILRRRLTTEGNLLYWAVLFSILGNKVHNIRIWWSTFL